ncbi:MAG: hypothetical protein JWN67_1834 [Actinomycetia bacterium]|nr:hypothetical protein [Actinomycetes bacterium]
MAQQPILAKPEQLERERCALRLYAQASLQTELERAKSLFAGSPLAATESGRSTLDAAVEALGFQAALYAANHDTVVPFILWGTNAAHDWMGLEVPGSGYGLDAPDNVYRHATIDGAARYRITGTVADVGPAQQTFVVYRTIPGVTQTMNAEGHMDELAGIKSEAISLDPDGSFTITIDGDPAGGRPNHLQVPADEHGLHVVVRDSLADWSLELPVDLAIERLDPPAGYKRPSEEAMARHAGEILSSYAPFWLNWYETYVHAKPLNEVPQPWRRVQGWGMTQQGCFALGPDEVWLVTVDPLDARFFDFQISDPWTRAVEYVDRTGSFNASQAERNADGTITLVAGPSDPGVHNWLDTAGLTAGTFQVRWQSLPGDVTADAAVRDARVVRMDDLGPLLPDGTRFVTPEERRRQQQDRATTYRRRLGT